MAHVLNRTTKEYLHTGAPKNFPEVDWIRNPNVSAVQGWPTKYWIITGDVVTLMNQEERDIVDAAEEAALLLGTRATAVDAVDNESSIQMVGTSVRAIIELFNKRDNYLTTRIEELQDAMAAMKATSGGTSNLRNAIPSSFLATNTRSRPEAHQDYKDIINSGDVDT